VKIYALIGLVWLGLPGLRSLHAAAAITAQPAVELAFPVAALRQVVLEQSSDLTSWAARELIFQGSPTQVVRHVRADAAGGFFRLQESPVADLTSTLETLRAQRGIPALAAAAIRSNVLVAAGASGLRKHGVPSAPVTVLDRFHLGSCTKSMTATLAAVLVEEGRIRWTDTVGAAFPELSGTLHADWKAVTLEQLLRNRGGAPGHAWLASVASSGNLWARLWTNQVTPVEQRQLLVQEVTRRAPEVAPGTAYLYSNAGFAIAGRMLEKAAGQPWEDLIRDRLFLPLGLASAGIGVPASPRYLDQPWGHTWNNGPVPVPPGTDADNPPAIGPAGTVHMTVIDFARYAAAHVRGARDGFPFLPRARFAELHHGIPVNADFAYAMGWEVVERPWGNGTVLTHTGSNNQWYAVMWIAPNKDFAAVAIANAGGTPALQALDAAVGTLVARYAN
jgi:CubicO group peptidase (beta-lactamase class C family)